MSIIKRSCRYFTIQFHHQMLHTTKYNYVILNPIGISLTRKVFMSRSEKLEWMERIDKEESAECSKIRNDRKKSGRQLNFNY